MRRGKNYSALILPGTREKKIIVRSLGRARAKKNYSAFILLGAREKKNYSASAREKVARQREKL